MTKHTINLSFFLVLLFIGFNSQSQDQSGSITYKGIVNEKFVDSFLVAYKKKDRPMSVKQDVIKAMKNAKVEEFILNFKNDESYYYKKPNLEDQNYLMGSRAGTTPYYTNSSKDMIIEMSRALGNINKIPLEWEITSKTKKIGNYTCRQAKTTEKLYSRQGHFFYKDVVAWFTPDISISFGPKNYNGLPGLILQIEDREYTLTAIKINLNPSDDVKIKRIDKKDKVISEKESYRRIEEMMSDRERNMSRN
jgi:GLPGLI family protein